MPRAYGWRPSLPDHRDHSFRFVPHEHMLAALPPTFDLDSPSPGSPFDPCFDQGDIGSCGPSSLAENIIYDLLKATGIAQPPSRLFLYYNARLLMGTVDSDSGVDNRSLLKAFAQYGWCDESLWPYDTSKFTVKPPQACYEQAAQRAGQIKYQAVAQDLATMKACLYQTGRPFLLGFTVYKSMESPAVDATGVIPMPGMFDSVVGGHDVLAVGWNDARQLIKVKNHWTPQWGDHGYGYIPYAYATNSRLSGDYWTVTNVVAAPQPAPSPPAPSPTPVPPPAPHPAAGIGVTMNLAMADGSKYQLTGTAKPY